MRKPLAMLARLAACALALAPVVLCVGTPLAGDWRRPALWLLLACALALGAAMLPGKRRVRVRAIPLRLTVVLLMSALIVAAFTLLKWPRAEWPRAAGIGCGVMVAAVFALAVRECCAPEPVFGRPAGLYAGIGLYLAAGVAVWALDLSVLNAALFGCAAAYLALVALLLNAESLDVGYASSRASRPSAGVLRANRLLLALVLAAVGFVAMFERIREWTADAALAALRALARLLGWLASLLPLGDGGGPIEGGGAGWFPAEEAGEPSAIWQILYYAALAVALVALAFLLYWAARALARALKSLAGRLAAYFRRFAQSVGEDYADERTRLFDAGELRRLMRGSVKRAVRRITWREKRWEQMDAKEKVRFVVRSLYRRAGDAERLRPMTIREAARHLGISDADPDALAELYERARYGEAPIADEEADALKDRVKI